MPKTKQKSSDSADSLHRAGSAISGSGLKDKNGTPINEGDTVTGGFLGRPFKIERVKFYGKWRLSIHQSIYWLTPQTAAMCEVVTRPRGVKSANCERGAESPNADSSRRE